MSCTVDLGGVWSLACSKWEKGTTIPAQLPGDNYTALRDAELIPDPYFGRNECLIQEYRDYDWTYSREFDVPEELLAFDSVYLNAEMVDTFASFYINGKKVLGSDNMFARYRPEVKRALKPGRNTIEIRFKSAAVEAKKAANALLPHKIPMSGCSAVPGLNLIRKVHCHGGWDWGITMMVTGIYAPLTLTGVNRARIECIYADQKHEKNRVEVTAVAELEVLEAGRVTVDFTFNGETKSVTTLLKPGRRTVKAVFTVTDPKLWWPNGLGDPDLYLLTVATDCETVNREIGLRTIEIINKPDEYGISMIFRVNGFDVFAKGADWIPADAFPSRQTPEAVGDLLESARLANMNMLRVWGGGQYEHEFFYELCDRKGLMIWQDMMFSCSLYPSSDAFIATVCNELEFQIKRLRSHACIALWCGDNEVIGATKWYDPAKSQLYLIHYDRLNRELGKMVKKCDPTRMFWPSSPCGGPDNFEDGWHNDSCGDMHYWEVWHGAKDFSAYYAVKPRFCSEFGYQSFPSFETVASYCPPEQFNVFSPVMDHHQKCSKGNAPIIGMFGKYFRMPESFTDFLYLSQTQQALAIKTGVEFWRTLKPRCMGTLFWQLNDNWPVASWASIEYGGKWKQLNYHAKRFFAPVIATMYKDEEGVSRLYAVSDLRVRAEVKVEARILDFDGNELAGFDFKASLKPGESKCLRSFREAELAQFDPAESFMELSTRAVASNGTVYTHENSCFFDVFKRCNLKSAAIEMKVEEQVGRLIVRLKTDKPAFYVTLDTPGVKGLFSDNSFTLLPGREKIIEFLPKAGGTLEELRKALKENDLRKTYR